MNEIERKALRARFEAWRKTLMARPNLMRNGEDYEDYDTQIAWSGWQAALATQQPQGECRTCAPNGVYATDGTGPYDCYACGKTAGNQSTLWCLHVMGVDELYPAPSRAHAEKAADAHNAMFKERAARSGINLDAVVVPWPLGAESHAAGVADFIQQWLLPRWQVEAYEANAAATSPERQG